MELNQENKHVKRIRGSWYLKDYYLWDNWCCDSRNYDNKIHRFSLCASKILNNKKLDPDERHNHAYIEHAYSIDNGETWNNTGPCIDPNEIQKYYTSLWSGSTAFHIDDNNQIKFIMAMTVVNKNNDGTYHQKIGIARSDDCKIWSPIEVCLEYENQICKKKYGYDYSNGDKEGYIWRDPYLWKNPNDNQYHLFFAAKKNDENNNFKACIGHAICNNDNQLFNQWKLQPGIEIPSTYGQAELPTIIYYKNYYYLFTCCQSANQSIFETKGQTCYCIFVSKHLTSGWTSIFSSTVYSKQNNCDDNDDKNNDEMEIDDIFINKKIYGIAVFQDKNKKPCAVAYYDRLSSGDHYLTLTPLIPITWNDHVEPPIPTIQYNQLLIRHDVDDELKNHFKNNKELGTNSNKSINDDIKSQDNNIQYAKV